VLPEGAVLVVGSGQSGAQIAEELHRSGRKVYLSVSRAGRAPRRYRGRDVMDWFRLFGLFDQTVDQLDSPSERFDAHPHISGRDGGKTINLRRLGREGVILLGKVDGAKDECIFLAPDLDQNLHAADSFAEQLCRMIDRRVAAMGIDAPQPAATETLSENWAPSEVLHELSLADAGISVVVWATGYSFDFSWIEAPVFDAFGYPIQQQGITACPGLYFAGLHWLHKFKSGLLYGVAEDAEHVARHIAASRA
jgi:putative flavoprotein involved in K+ transport